MRFVNNLWKAVRRAFIDYKCPKREWLACAKIRDLLYRSPTKFHPRKHRLFCCACCRHIWHLIQDQRSRQAVEMVEKYVEGLATWNHMITARLTATPKGGWSWGAPDGRNPLRTDAAFAVLHASMKHGSDEIGKTAICALYAVRSGEGAEGEAKESAYQCDAFRDIFGSPFRRVKFKPVWRSSTVVSLAQAIYRDRALDRMPIVADALEEAGCTSADVLNHCRQPGEHVRGCWVVDLVLAKP
jgi:hypothetical protein